MPDCECRALGLLCLYMLSSMLLAPYYTSTYIGIYAPYFPTHEPCASQCHGATASFQPSVTVTQSFFLGSKPLHYVVHTQYCSTQLEPQGYSSLDQINTKFDCFTVYVVVFDQSYWWPGQVWGGICWLATTYWPRMLIQHIYRVAAQVPSSFQISIPVRSKQNTFQTMVVLY